MYNQVLVTVLNKIELLDKLLDEFADKIIALHKNEALV